MSQNISVTRFKLTERLVTCRGCGADSIKQTEKRADVRIALDIIRLAHANKYDVAVVFSQDQDLSEVAVEIHTEIFINKNRWIRMACAFPHSQNLDHDHRRGINRTDWIRIPEVYDSHLDLRDYSGRKNAHDGR